MSTVIHIYGPDEAVCRAWLDTVQVYPEPVFGSEPATHPEQLRIVRDCFWTRDPSPTTQPLVVLHTPHECLQGLVAGA